MSPDPTGAQAQTVAYTNGPINGTENAYTISAGTGYNVIDSFTLSSPTTITGFSFGGWTYPNDPITSVSYNFGTSANTFAPTGTADLTSTFVNNNAQGAEVRDYTASITPIAFTAGTYYFGLGNQTNSNGAFWDESDGPSTAYQTNSGDVSSESFTLFAASASATTGAVPEPATWAMMMLGFGMIGFGLRRRSKVNTAVRFA